MTDVYEPEHEGNGAVGYPQLREGLLRVFGTSDTRMLGGATRPYGKCYGVECIEMIDGHACHHNTSFIRQSIPSNCKLPTRIPHPDYCAKDIADGGIKLRCLCGVLLKHAHIAYLAADPSRNAIIGSCCLKHIERCEDDRRGRLCSKCHASHQNRKDNYCNNCRDLRVNEAEEIAKGAAKSASRAVSASLSAIYASSKANVALGNIRKATLRCVDCGRAGMRSPYIRCFGCNSAIMTSKCLKCSKPCRPTFRICWGCR
jgi:hypothetical protein